MAEYFHLVCKDCPCVIANAGSEDLNRNGLPDVCDPDCDDDGVPDFLEILEGTSQDHNKNGIPDECEVLRFVDNNTSIETESRDGLSLDTAFATGASSGAAGVSRRDFDCLPARAAEPKVLALQPDGCSGFGCR